MSGGSRAAHSAAVEAHAAPSQLRGTERDERPELERTDPWETDTPESDDLQGVTVLLVEDDALSREALEMIFAYHGARVVAAETAAEALGLFERGLPTIMVSDIGLPAEDGCALVRAIRTREFGRGRHTPAIAISAFPGRETSERARGAGFDAFVAKPIEIGALLRLMRELTARSL